MCVELYRWSTELEGIFVLPLAPCWARHSYLSKKATNDPLYLWVIRGVSSVTATSLQFPSVHYFTLFIAKCLLPREKVGALSAPDFAVLRRALYADNSYSLGAIIARRLHLNRSKGKIHGGIYATHLASHFNIQIRQHDYPFPKVYLDRAAMEHHQFIPPDYPNIPVPYNLVFSVDTRDIIPFPAAALFDPIARGGNRIMPEDIVANRNNQTTAQEEPHQWDPHVPAP